MADGLGGAGTGVASAIGRVSGVSLASLAYEGEGECSLPFLDGRSIISTDSRVGDISQKCFDGEDNHEGMEARLV